MDHDARGCHGERSGYQAFGRATRLLLEMHTFERNASVAGGGQWSGGPATGRPGPSHFHGHCRSGFGADASGARPGRRGAALMGLPAWAFAGEWPSEPAGARPGRCWTPGPAALWFSASASPRAGDSPRPAHSAEPEWGVAWRSQAPRTTACSHRWRQRQPAAHMSRVPKQHDSAHVQ